MHSTPYYDELKEMKQNGMLFKFEEITKEQLRKIWHEEALSDYMISELFDVAKSKVTNTRKKMGLSMYECIWEDVMEQYQEMRLTNS